MTRYDKLAYFLKETYVEAFNDGRTIQNIIDCLPRRDFEINDRESRKMNF